MTKGEEEETIINDRSFLISEFEIEKQVPCSVEWWSSVEKAYWYYIDIILPKRSPKTNILYRVSEFQRLYYIGEWLFNTPGEYDHINLFQSLKAYKYYKDKIPVAGCMIFSNEYHPRLLMIRPYKCKSWQIPKGKALSGESAFTTACRETYEEVGYQIDPGWEHKYKSILVPRHKSGPCTLYIITNVSINYPFQTRTRGEVERIEWKRIERRLPLCKLSEKALKILHLL